MPHASDAASAEAASVDASQGCGSRTLNAWTRASQTAPCVRNSRRRGERRWRVRLRSVRRRAPPRHSTVRSSGESRAALPTCRRRACLSDGSAIAGAPLSLALPRGGRRVRGTQPLPAAAAAKSSTGGGRTAVGRRVETIRRSSTAARRGWRWAASPAALAPRRTMVHCGGPVAFQVGQDAIYKNL